MFKSCLICTDFTDGLQKLVYFVSSLGKGGMQEIVFLHSVSLWQEGEIPRVDQNKIDQAKQNLSPALENIPDGVNVKIEVPSGEPLDTIPKIIKDHSIDLIIVATPLRSAWQEKVFGSTTMELAKFIDIPLMILRPQLISVYTQEELSLRCQHLTRSLLIPFDDSKNAHYLLSQIKNYASKQTESYVSKCILLWTIEDVSRSEILVQHHLEEAKIKLNKIKIDLEKLGLDVQVEVRTGKPLNEVLDVACQYDISAIAIVADQEKGLLRWTVSSFTQEILHRSWFPLLFFTKKD